MYPGQAAIFKMIFIVITTVKKKKKKNSNRIRVGNCRIRLCRKYRFAIKPNRG